MTIAGQIVSGTLTGTGSVGPYQPFGNRRFNVFITGTFDAQVVIQKSWDGVTYTTVVSDEFGGSASFNQAVAAVVTEPDAAVTYLVTCLAFTSGSIDVRIG